MTIAPSAVWVNGERRAVDGPHLSARDRGFTLADGLFETMRVRNGVAFRFERHLARLVHGLDVLAIAVPSRLRAWALAATVEADRTAALRLTVTRGARVAPQAEASPTVVIAAGPLPAFDAAIYERGLSMHVASGRLNERAMTAGLKTLAYTDAVVALLEAGRAGADEALFLNTASQCAEASFSNLFVVHHGALLTPPLSSGVLPGITREAVLEIAGAIGLVATERAFGIDELLAGDEAFLTSSLRGIAPVVRVDSRVIGTGRPGSTTRQVADAYGALVEHECRSPTAAGFERDR